MDIKPGQIIRLTSDVLIAILAENKRLKRMLGINPDLMQQVATDLDRNNQQTSAKISNITPGKAADFQAPNVTQTLPSG